MISEKKMFQYFFENLHFMSSHQPIKLSDFDKGRMKCGELLNKHFCKKISNIPNDSAEIANFRFSHYKGAFTSAFFLWKRPNVTETMVNYLRSYIATKSVKETMSKNLG